MRIDLDDPPEEARPYVDLYERTRAQADQRIAELEARVRRSETEATEHRRQIAELEARVRSMHNAARMASETNEAVTAKLVRWAPIVDAASRVVASWCTNDNAQGARACDDLYRTVTSAEKEPTA